jgi:hypothetical protein
MKLLSVQETEGTGTEVLIFEIVRKSILNPVFFSTCLKYLQGLLRDGKGNHQSEATPFMSQRFWLE